jgi:hypothetical protein
MAAIAANDTNNALTGSGTQDEIFTPDAGSNKGAVSAIFLNVAGATRSIIFYLGGTSSSYKIATIELLDGEWVVVDMVQGASVALYAEASAGSSIQWATAEIEEG